MIFVAAAAAAAARLVIITISVTRKKRKRTLQNTTRIIYALFSTVKHGAYFITAIVTWRFSTPNHRVAVASLLLIYCEYF